MTDTRAPQQWMKEAANEGYEAFNQWVEKLLRFSDVPPAHELKDNLAAIIAAHCPRQAVENFRRDNGRDPGVTFHCHDEECEDCFGC